MDDGTIKINQGDIQSVFLRLRGTSQYWRVARNELAKVKQPGPFEFFFTLSCAEMRWPEVSVSILKSTGYKIFVRQPLQHLMLFNKLHEFLTEAINRSSSKILSDYEGSLQVSFFTFRFKMQLRGLALVHDCLWLHPEFFAEKCIQVPF